MTDLPNLQTQAALFEEARRLLRFQGELGLLGLDVSPACLTPRPALGADVEPAAGARPSARPAAVATSSSAPAIPATWNSKQPAGMLQELTGVLGACSRCKLSRTRTHIVFGVGNPQARLMFVGEGPGRDEDLQGEPFVGAAGQLLDKMVKAMGLARGEVYIANVVKCRPPKNRDPELDEVAACEPFLKAQIGIIKPEILVALGRHAAQTLLRTETAISRLRGHWHSYEGIPLMPTYHPAYLLRAPDEKRAAWEDLQLVMAKLGLADPRRAK